MRFNYLETRGYPEIVGRVQKHAPFIDFSDLSQVVIMDKPFGVSGRGKYTVDSGRIICRIRLATPLKVEEQQAIFQHNSAHMVTPDTEQENAEEIRATDARLRPILQAHQPKKGGMEGYRNGPVNRDEALMITTSSEQPNFLSQLFSKDNFRLSPAPAWVYVGTSRRLRD